MLHGIAAYSRDKGIYALINRVRTVLSGAEICCADVAIGNIGVSVSGHVSYAWSADCWSEIAGDGSRECGNHNSRYHRDWRNTSCCNPTAGELSEIVETRVRLGNPYAELWVTKAHIDYVWVKRSASRYVKMAARVIARAVGVGVLTVRDDYDITRDLILDDSDAPAAEIERIEVELMGY